MAGGFTFRCYFQLAFVGALIFCSSSSSIGGGATAATAAATDGKHKHNPPFRRRKLQHSSTTNSSNSNSKNNNNNNYVLRWAASGGGWGAMVANMGFANLFAQAGLIGKPESSSSTFSAISSNSGGTWFATQFFYSPTFFERVVDQDTRHLRELIENWMQAYSRILLPSSTTTSTTTNDDDDDDDTTTNADDNVCKLISLIPTTNMLNSNGLEEWCTILLHYKGSWAHFIQDMLQRTSSEAYDDPQFTNRTAGYDNRVAALASTDLLIQTTLVPTSATTTTWNNDDDDDGQKSQTIKKTLSYVGPKHSGSTPTDNRVYSVPLAVQYTVTKSNTSYQYGVSPESLPFSVQWSSQAPEKFKLDDWRSNYYLYSNDGVVKKDHNGSILTKPLLPVDGVATLNPLFGGRTPTVTQLAAASSAAVGGLSGSVPSLLAQILSLLLASASSQQQEPFIKVPIMAEWLLRQAVETLGSVLYSNPLWQKTAVCSQWPNEEECGPQDAQLIDGGYVDNNAFVLNIGHYHRTTVVDNNNDNENNKGDDLPEKKTLKIILTDADIMSSERFCSYFRTDYNQDVAPGDFIWPVSSLEDGDFATPNPIPSLQIFNESMNQDILESLRRPVEGTDLTSAIITSTTIDNPAYGVRAGQRVDILYLETHSPRMIPPVIVGQQMTQFWTPHLVSMAMDIASVGSKQLLARLDAFLAM